MECNGTSGFAALSEVQRSRSLPYPSVNLRISRTIETDHYLDNPLILESLAHNDSPPWAFVEGLSTIENQVLA